MDIDFQALKEPLDAEGGVGPDLSDDPAFAQFEADVEGFLPSRAEDFHYRFRTANSDLDTFADRCLALLARSRDLRLMVPIAKIAALGGDLRQSREALGLIRHALEHWWDSVHPAATASGHNLRGVTVERLDEFASFVLPLQYAPLVSDRNGHVSYRDHAVATGAVIAREDDSHPDPADIARFLERCDLEKLVEARDLAAGMVADLSAIVLVWAANAQDPPSLAFNRLQPVLEKASAFLEAAVAERDPSRASGPATPEDAGDSADTAAGEGTPADAGEAPTKAAAGRPADTIASLADARAALHAASRYFELYEPSSPAFLLARKAENLVGLTFPQVLQQIAPDRVYDTAIQLGGKRNLPLPLEKLTEEFGYIEIEREEASEPTRTFEAKDRASAMSLLADVSRWYRNAEPSNPIPLLLDKAREMTSKDFAALLSDITIPQE